MNRPTLFAQLPAPIDLPVVWLFTIVIVVVGSLFVASIFWLLMRYAAKSREFSHQERMKALELGKIPADPEAEGVQDQYASSAFWIAFWIGIGVPVAATSAATSVIVQASLHDFPIVLAIWICVAVICLGSVISAAALVATSRRRGKDERTMKS
jgi:hypothetical protein